jgi:MFS family permease
VDRNLRLLGLGAGIRTLGAALYSPFLALFLVNGLGLGYLEVGVIFVGVGAVQAPFSLAGGLLTDRVGRRRLIVLGLGAEAATTALLAYGFGLHSLAFSIIAATLGGIVTNSAGPASSAYVADFSEGSDRTRGFTWLRIGANAGYSAGTAMGGLLTAAYGFAPTVAVAAVIITAGALFFWAVLKPSPVDQAMSTGRPLDRARTSGAPVAPGRPLRASLKLIARDRVALELLVAIGLAALVLGQWAVTFPLFVHNVLGIPYSLLGLGLALNGLVVVFGQSLTTERVIGWRHTSIAALGIVLYVVAFLGLGAAGLFGVFPAGVFFGAVVVLTFGENLVTIPQTTLPSNLAPPGEVGSYNGAFNMVGGIGTLIAFLFGTAVLATTSNPVLIWSILALPAIASIILLRDSARRLAPDVDRA